MPRATQKEVSIGKFDILATYTYARARADGLDDDEARQLGIVAAIMGARARMGRSAGHDPQADREAAEAKSKSTITAKTFDDQVAHKMGAFFKTTFLPAMTRLVEADLSYDDVKRRLRIPSTWGAKITGEQFRERSVTDS